MLLKVNVTPINDGDRELGATWTIKIKVDKALLEGTSVQEAFRNAWENAGQITWHKHLSKL